jgi:hypothetical protein
VNRFTHDIIDVHQHLWPGDLIAALRSRSRPPRLRGWTLELAGEPPSVVDPRDHDVARRAKQASADGLTEVVVSLSSALGVESLPPDEARELLEAWHAGARELPAPFGAWAGACLTDIDAAALERRLDEGFAGLQLPATAAADEAGYERIGPLLEALERRGAPLFLHPGPAAPPPGSPPWWPAMVDYVTQMHAAWYAFRAHGRERHPRLRVMFGLLAGLAPLHGERFAARAGARTVVDPLVFLETSSYGTRAVDVVVRVLGIDVLVAGSDRPYAAPSRPELGAAARHALSSVNPIRLLRSREVSGEHLELAGARS